MLIQENRKDKEKANIWSSVAWPPWQRFALPKNLDQEMAYLDLEAGKRHCQRRDAGSSEAAVLAGKGKVASVERPWIGRSASRRSEQQLSGWEGRRGRG